MRNQDYNGNTRKFDHMKDDRETETAVKTRDSIKIAHAISVGIYLVSAIGVTSIIAGIVLTIALNR